VVWAVWEVVRILCGAAIPNPLVDAASGSLRWARSISPSQGGSDGTIAVLSLESQPLISLSLSGKTGVNSSSLCVWGASSSRMRGPHHANRDHVRHDDNRRWLPVCQRANEPMRW